MSIRLVAKIFIVYKPQKILILLRRDKIFRLYYFSSKYLNRKKANQSYM